MIIYLFRHGKTKANENRLYCGSTDLPLSDLGQAELKAIPPAPLADVYAHSGLKRAAQSLEILCGEDKNAIEIPDLREMSFGEFEMLSYEQLKEDPLYIDWIEERREAPPRGESKREFKERIINGFKKLKNLCPKDGSVLALTHGGVIAVLMEELLPGQKNFYEWQPACGHGIKIEMDRNSVISTENI